MSGFKTFWSSLSGVLMIFTLTLLNAICMQGNAIERLYLRLERNSASYPHCEELYHSKSKILICKAVSSWCLAAVDKRSARVQCYSLRGHGLFLGQMKNCQMKDRCDVSESWQKCLCLRYVVFSFNKSIHSDRPVLIVLKLNHHHNIFASILIYV